MKDRSPPFSVLLLAVSLPAIAHSADLLSSAQAKAAIEAEQTLVEQATLAADRSDYEEVGRYILSEEGQAGQIAPSVLIGRRAVGVCAWLRNHDNCAAAIQVAERVVAHLQTMREENDSDRAERLYWEAVLTGDFLGKKEEAFYLLQEAELLAPDDERILDTSLQLAQALAEFGK